MYIPFLGDISPEASYEGLSTPQSMIIKHLIDVHAAINTIEQHNAPAEPVYMGHNYENQYAALTTPQQPYQSDFSKDMTIHMRSTAVQPETLEHPELISSAPVLRIVGDVANAGTIMNKEARPLDAEQTDRMPDYTAISNTAFTDNVSVNPVVVDLSAYRSGLNVPLITQAAIELAIPGDKARADLAQAA
ncbi:MAG: hypothetical protein JWO47_224 [Candidatus Saccharibacteria bacterium]|nr:hypothetical protein [Candidatus Saccharibacteria bacterium]